MNIRNLEPNANRANFIPRKTQEMQFLDISYLIEIEIIQMMGFINSHLKRKKVRK